MTSAARPRPTLRVVYALLVLAMAGAWLVSAGLPAAAAQDWSVRSPSPGEVVTGPFDIHAEVVSFQDQQIDAVRSRFRLGDQAVGEVRNLQRRGESEDATLPGQKRSTWSGSTSVSGLPNGTYVVEVSVVNSLYPNGSAWRGHEVVVDVPPTATLEIARVADADARKVELRWARSTAPDHVRYVVQRARSGGGFTDVHTEGPVDTTTHVDTVPEHGDYQYRLKVVRLGADGSERQAVSQPRSVSVKPGASGRPENEPQPGSPGDDDDAPGDGDASPGGSRPAPPQLSGRSSSAPSTTSARSQRPNVAPPPNPNSTFEERLDYGELPEWANESADPESMADAGAGAASGDAGTLTVFGGQDMTADQVLKPVAGGLVLTLFGLHIVRFLRTSP